MAVAPAQREEMLAAVARTCARAACARASGVRSQVVDRVDGARSSTTMVRRRGCEGRQRDLSPCGEVRWADRVSRSRRRADRDSRNVARGDVDLAPARFVIDFDAKAGGWGSLVMRRMGAVAHPTRR
jgi:hypothetical protein